MTETSRDPSTDTPLNPPEVPIEDKPRELLGKQPQDQQTAYFDRSEVDDLGQLTSTDVYEGELEAGVNDDLPNDPENIEMLTELELRAEETDDPMEAVEEGFTYVPPIDPPIVPGAGQENAEIASGLGVSSLDEPYDEDHHDSFLDAEDEVSARVREHPRRTWQCRADPTRRRYAATGPSARARGERESQPEWPVRKEAASSDRTIGSHRQP